MTCTTENTFICYAKTVTVITSLWSSLCKQVPNLLTQLLFLKSQPKNLTWEHTQKT